MECPRCTGMMVAERFEDLQDDTGNLFFDGWHCLVCGEILDPLIAHNREKPPKPYARRNRKLFVYG